MKRLYEFALPLRTNAGASYQAAHSKWTDFALGYCEGVTIFPAATGLWRDKSGKMYSDKMVSYRVLCAQGVMEQLRSLAFDLFHDQVALFVSDLGTAEITYRPKLDTVIMETTAEAHMNWKPGNRAQVRAETNTPWPEEWAE